ncbi:MAG TPA: hypothetical protein VJ900_02610 [Patescibacteria group bacterium]|nr:hypothetical protein [Patescibacteria group bacterium]
MKNNIKSKEKAFSFFGWIFILLIFIIVTSILSIFFLDKPETLSGDKDIEFWLYRHSPQVTGEKHSYYVFVRNDSGQDLEDVQINIDFPSGFNLISSEINCQETNGNCSWEIDKIKKGTLFDLEFTGKLFGAPEKKYFNGGLNFHLQGFSSRFYKSFENNVLLNSPINLKWEIPQKAGLGEKIESSIYLDNDGKSILPITRLRVEFPEDFIVQAYKSEDPDITGQLKEDYFYWDINDLNFRGEKKLTFSGFFKNADKRQHFFKVEALIPFEENKFIQKSEKRPVLIGQGVDINLKVADSEKGPIIAKWGQTLPIDLSYYNTNDQKIKDLELDVDFLGEKYLKNSPNFNWEIDTLDKADFIEKSGDLNIVSSLNALKNNFNHSKIKLIPKARGRFENYSNFWQLQGEPIEIKMSTDLSLRTGARFYTDEGLKIGQGPIPMKVGSETRLWIFWNLKNTTNDLENIEVNTKLPKFVNWTGNFESSVGTLSYDKESQTVFWRIPELKAFKGGAHSLVQGKFELSIRPEPDDKDKVLPLTGVTRVRAKDNFCQSEVFDSSPGLDTTFESDPMIQGSGKVQ